MSSALLTALSDLEEAAVLDEVKRRLAAGESSGGILEDCRDGMIHVGKRFENDEYFISDLMMAGHIFKQATALLDSGKTGEAREPVGVIVMGTVKGDVHNIGKDLVVGLLRAANFAVSDLGIDVPPESFVETVKETGATVVGLSGLLTTSFDPMRDTVAALAAAGLRDKVKVMIGGGPVTGQVCKYAGADGWAANAQSAVTMANAWT
ncbi:MAG TPA: cobalamin-dependent protein [Coriobacteriia bacterium]|nr:cobalamin-dependent protein [Coriobacteriia bacterium]